MLARLKDGKIEDVEAVLEADAAQSRKARVIFRTFMVEC